MSAQTIHLPTRMSLFGLIDKWGTYTERRFTPATNALYQYAIRRFAAAMPDNIQDVTLEHIERYLSSGRLKRCTNRSVNLHLICIKSFYRWAAERYDNIPNLASRIRKMPEAPPKQHILTDGQYEQILEAATPQERDVIEFLANSGLRSCELLSLTRGNLDLSNRLLHITGKGRRHRSVPLNKTCLAILARQPDCDPFHFSKSYTIHAKNALYYMCQRLRSRAALRFAFGPHSLRHFFATKMMRKGVPIAVISKILGHSSVKTTEIYLHITDFDVVGSTDCLD